jgi:hypothetical protein
MAFPDKRRSDAITARKLWENHCIRAFFFKAYRAEAAEVAAYPMEPVI